MALAGGLFPLALSAQMRGSVTDAQGRAVGYANVVALAPADSAVIAACLTDKEGHFSFADTVSVTLLRISALGYEPLYYTGRNDGQPVSLTLQPARDVQLGEAEVVGRRPVAHIENGALVTQIEHTLLAKRGSAEDVLKEIPGLIDKGDENGTIEVIGRGEPVIYVNGRKLQDKSELRTLSSEEIRQVEVIANPGAAYEADARAVVRIRTLRRKGEGWGANLRSNHFQGRHYENDNTLKLSYRKDAVDVALTGGYSRTNQFWDAIGDIYTSSSDTQWKMLMTQITSVKRHTGFGTAELNYSPSDKLSLGARYQLQQRWNMTRRSVLDSRVYANDAFLDHLATDIYQPTRFDPQHNLNVYYNGRIGKGELAWDADFFASSEDCTQTTHEDSRNNDNRDINTRSDARTRVVSTKLQYTFPFLRGKWTAGGQYTLTNHHDNYLPEAEEYGLSTARSQLREHTGAAFVEYTTILAKRVQLTAGLRYEHCDQSYYSNRQHIASQSPTYDNLFPSLSLATQLGKWQLMAGYTSKTARPAYSDLTNTTTYANRFLLTKGNANLKPSVEHSLQLAAVYGWLQLAATYDYSKDHMLMYGQRLEGSTDVNLISYINHDVQTATLSVVASPTVKFWHPTVALSLYESICTLDYQGRPKHFNNPIFTAQVRQAFDLPSNFKLSIVYHYQGCGNYQNIQVVSAQHTLNADITRTFLHDALTVVVGGHDLLYKQRTEAHVYAGTLILSQGGRGDTRYAYLKLSYNFNARTDKYKGQSSLEETLKRL